MTVHLSSDEFSSSRLAVRILYHIAMTGHILAELSSRVIESRLDSIAKSKMDVSKSKKTRSLVLRSNKKAFKLSLRETTFINATTLLTLKRRHQINDRYKYNFVLLINHKFSQYGN